MKSEIARFLTFDDGAATFDWLLLAASLATLAVVSVGTALGSFTPDPLPPPPVDQAADAASMPLTGLGS